MWKAEEAQCERCGHEWVSVHPCAERLECPLCHYMSQSLPYKPNEKDTITEEDYERWLNTDGED